MPERFSRVAPDEMRINEPGSHQELRIRFDIPQRLAVDLMTDSAIVVSPDWINGGMHCVIAGAEGQVASMLALLNLRLAEAGFGPLLTAITRGETVCAGCGCHDSRACDGGCGWSRKDPTGSVGLCSRCADVPAEMLKRRGE